MQTNESVYYGTVKEMDWTFFIAATDKGLCFISSQIHEPKHVEKWIPNGILEENNLRINPYANQLMEYIKGERKKFELPIDFSGTSFQTEVWQALQSIPFGETRTYSDIAKMIGKPSAVRAVASAIGKNPILIVVPCHRVIRKNGELSGFREGIMMKKKLLELEKA